MNCPVCDASLRVINKYGVEVDICPGCKGIWLDRGELEKVIEMEAAGGPTQDVAPGAPNDTRSRAPQSRDHTERRYRDDDDDDDEFRERRPQSDQHGRPTRKRRESWFSELFDGFGD